MQRRRLPAFQNAAGGSSGCSRVACRSRCHPFDGFAFSGKQGIVLPAALPLLLLQGFVFCWLQTISPPSSDSSNLYAKKKCKSAWSGAGGLPPVGLKRICGGWQMRWFPLGIPSVFMLQTGRRANGSTEKSSASRAKGPQIFPRRSLLPRKQKKTRSKEPFFLAWSEFLDAMFFARATAFTRRGSKGAKLLKARGRRGSVGGTENTKSC